MGLDRLFNVFLLSVLLLTGNSVSASTVLADDVLWDLHTFDSESPDHDFDQVLAFTDARWKEAPSYTLNYGLQDAPVWIRLRAQNLHAEISQHRFFSIAYPTLDSVTIWITQRGKVLSKHEMGDRFPFKARAYAHRDFLAEVTIPPGGDITLYARIQSSGSLIVPVSFLSPREQTQKDQNDLLIHGGFLSILIAMAIYNLLVGVTLREKSYLLYVVYLVSLAGVYSSLFGFSYQYLWPAYPILAQYSVGFFTLVSAFFAMRFFVSFLDISKQLKGVNFVLRGVSIFIVLWMPLMFVTPYKYTVYLSSIFAVTVALICLLGGAFTAYKGSVIAKYYLLAWCCFILGGLLFLVNKLGLINQPAFAENSFRAGTILEVVFLSLALTHRIHEERNQRYEAQKIAFTSEYKLREAQENALRMVQQANKELELKVRERTEKLETALTELHVAHDRLKESATRDGLTGLRNRPFFDELYAREWRRVFRSAEIMSVVMVDIDNFKMVNETSGHLTGDICLKKMSATIRKAIKRPGDEACRYGGEEFVILLPLTGLAGAQQVAESIRLNIQNLEIKIDGKHYPVTVSCGVAAIKPEEHNPQLTLLKMADIALYQAKKLGRNQTIVYQDFMG